MWELVFDVDIFQLEQLYSRAIAQALVNGGGFWISRLDQIRFKMASLTLQLCAPFIGDAAPNAAKRILVLSVFGSVIAGILALLQTQRSGVQMDGKMLLATFPVWTIAAALIGSIYPLADHWIYGRIHDYKQDWSNAVRSVAILVGIHQASTVSLSHVNVVI